MRMRMIVAMGSDMRVKIIRRKNTFDANVMVQTDLA